MSPKIKVPLLLIAIPALSAPHGSQYKPKRFNVLVGVMGHFGVAQTVAYLTAPDPGTDRIAINESNKKSTLEQWPAALMG